MHTFSRRNTKSLSEKSLSHLSCKFFPTPREKYYPFIQLYTGIIDRFSPSSLLQSTPSSHLCRTFTCSNWSSESHGGWEAASNKWCDSTVHFTPAFLPCDNMCFTFFCVFLYLKSVTPEFVAGNKYFVTSVKDIFCGEQWNFKLGWCVKLFHTVLTSFFPLSV